MAGDLMLALAVLVLLGLAATRLGELSSRDLTGEARIADGDSLVIEGERLRLRGIDAPELNQTCHRGKGDYACGREARAALAGLVAARRVVCRGWERDRYDRLLVHCRAGETDLNAAMVLAGWAVAYGDYVLQEKQAQTASRGLWGGSFDMPARWRTVHGGAVESGHDAAGVLLNWLRQLFRGM